MFNVFENCQTRKMRENCRNHDCNVSAKSLLKIYFQFFLMFGTTCLETLFLDVSSFIKAK